jgi:uncharacterized membrane protein YidH (DUF202 family)
MKDSMKSTIPIPTDNIYKFSCLFGLALIVAGIFSFIASYSSSLDRKIAYVEAMTALEAKTNKTEADTKLIAQKQHLIDVTKSNEKTVSYSTGMVVVLGLLLSFTGAMKWYKIIQPRDDKMAELQIEKMQLEIRKLEVELLGLKGEPSGTTPSQPQFV